MCVHVCVRERERETKRLGFKPNQVVAPDAIPDD